MKRKVIYILILTYIVTFFVGCKQEVEPEKIQEEIEVSEDEITVQEDIVFQQYDEKNIVNYENSIKSFRVPQVTRNLTLGNYSTVFPTEIQDVFVAANNDISTDDYLVEKYVADCDKLYINEWDKSEKDEELLSFAGTSYERFSFFYVADIDANGVNEYITEYPVETGKERHIVIFETYDDSNIMKETHTLEDEDTFRLLKYEDVYYFLLGNQVICYENGRSQLSVQKDVVEYNVTEVYSNEKTDEDFSEYIDLKNLEKTQESSEGIFPVWYTESNRITATYMWEEKKQDKEYSFIVADVSKGTHFSEDRLVIVLEKVEEEQYEVLKMYYYCADLEITMAGETTDNPMNNYVTTKVNEKELMEGTWKRTNTETYADASISIENWREGVSFDVRIDASYSIYSGTIEGTARITGENTAELKLNENDIIQFQFDGESIVVAHNPEICYQFGGEGTGTAEGIYTRSEPIYTTCANVGAIFSDEKLYDIYQLLQENYEFLFEDIIENGIVQRYDTAEGRMWYAYWPPYGVARCRVLIDNNGYIYIDTKGYGVEGGQYTNNSQDGEAFIQKMFETMQEIS